MRPLPGGPVEDGRDAGLGEESRVGPERDAVELGRPGRVGDERREGVVATDLERLAAEGRPGNAGRAVDERGQLFLDVGEGLAGDGPPLAGQQACAG